MVLFMWNRSNKMQMMWVSYVSSPGISGVQTTHRTTNPLVRQHCAPLTALIQIETK